MLSIELKRVALAIIRYRVWLVFLLHSLLLLLHIEEDIQPPERYLILTVLVKCRVCRKNISSNSSAGLQI
jgi:hypothetical protein